MTRQPWGTDIYYVSLDDGATYTEVPREVYIMLQEAPRYVSVANKKVSKSFTKRPIKGRVINLTERYG